MRKIRRGTRVVGAFPDGRSALMLVGERCIRDVGGEFSAWSGQYQAWRVPSPVSRMNSNRSQRSYAASS